MIAAIYTKYGSPEVIDVIDTEKPSPKPNEVLVKIIASSITRADTMIRLGKPRFGRLFLGVFKPKNTCLGTGFSGVIESVGGLVTKFKIDDEVFGEKLFSNGTNAEYLCIPEDSIMVFKPNNITHVQAAPICDGFLTSYSFLKDIGNLKKEQHILINGASGSLGTAAIQLAKNIGATVTGVCSTKNVDLVKSIGADHVIDYKKQDFTKTGNFYDVIYDTVGKSTYRRCKKILYNEGVFITPVLSISVLWHSIIVPKKVKFSATGIRKQNDLKGLLTELTTFFSQGKLNTIIDRTYKLENIVEAHKYIESDHKIGNIAIINQ